MKHRTSRRVMLLSCSLLCLVAAISVAQGAASGQHAPSLSSEDAQLRLLLIDGTRTFASTARVGALAGALKTATPHTLDVVFASGDGMYGIPALDTRDASSERFDAIVLIPRGLDDASADSIWIITNIQPVSGSEAWSQIAMLSGIVDQVFAGLATAVDSTDDLWVDLAAFYLTTEGWLR